MECCLLTHLILRFLQAATPKYQQHFLGICSEQLKLTILQQPKEDPVRKGVTFVIILLLIAADSRRRRTLQLDFPQ